MAWVTWGCRGEGVGVGGAEAAVAMSADEVDTLRPDSLRGGGGEWILDWCKEVCVAAHSLSPSSSSLRQLRATVGIRFSTTRAHLPLFALCDYAKSALLVVLLLVCSPVLLC